MISSTLPLTSTAALPGGRASELLGGHGFEPQTALGELFSPVQGFAAEAAIAERVAAAPRRLLGEMAEAVRLLPGRERERAAILCAWVEALFATGREPDPPERRTARLNRSAYLLARALAGEPSDSPFVRAFAAEAGRRSFTRPALDAQLGAARQRVEGGRPATRVEWERRARAAGESIAAALIGASPTTATVDAAAGLYRLFALRGLAAELASGRCHLPAEVLTEPLRYRDRDELTRAAAGECEAIRPLLLRGARALGEVPLTFRRSLAFLLSGAIAILGQIEVHPEALAARSPRLGWWARRTALWRLRRQAIA